jgi:DNA-binding beta-propeller fold protein YncE
MGRESDARFNHPKGITVDPRGTIYVADSRNNTIRKIAPGAVVNDLRGHTHWSMVQPTAQVQRLGFMIRKMSLRTVKGIFSSPIQSNDTIRRVTPEAVVTDDRWHGNWRVDRMMARGVPSAS